MKDLLIGRGHVHHSRTEGASNSFRYPIFFFQFPCEKEAALKNLLKRKFWKFISFKSSAYLNKSAGALNENINNFLRDSCSYEPEEVWLHTMPRMFGYAFNPVSFWFCKRAGNLEAVLIEVNNTFGERHFYWVHPPEAMTDATWFTAEKVFHVSPFFPVEGHYKFRFNLDSDKTRVDINYHGPDGKLRLATWVTGHLSPIEDISLVSILGRYGWMTPMVVLRIHLQAVRLWFKKSRFHSKPPLPTKKVTS